MSVQKAPGETRGGSSAFGTAMRPGRRKLLSGMGACLLAAAVYIGMPPAEPTRAYIVQGSSTMAARQALDELGVEVRYELSIIRAVSAELTPSQLVALRDADPGYRVYEDINVKTTGSFYRYTKEVDGKDPYLNFPGMVGANSLHEQGIDGDGITVAVIDSGIDKGSKEFKKNSRGNNRLLALYSAIDDKKNKAKDEFGHGSHITSIIGNSEPSNDGRYNSIAPGVDLVVVKAFGEDGSGVYSDVIRSMQWVWRNRDLYNIRVLNLSFSTAVRSHYWDDPLNQAVMELWRAGVVVVASAGNNGPHAMSVGVPGNVPYIITVGAMTDNFTPRDAGDDYLASFSAAGPTYEGFIKPEIVAPGGHLTGLMKKNTHLGETYPEFHNFHKYFTMSGTSQATAVVSGIVALLLQNDPGLDPDDVKCRLMATARPAAYPDGRLAFSVFQQGAGLVDAAAAVNDPSRDCANRGLDVSADIAGAAHFGGPAGMDENGNFTVRGLDGHSWNRNEVDGAGYFWNDGFFWSDSYFWSDAFFWNDGFFWNDAYFWNDAFFWNDGFFWNDSDMSTDALTAPVDVNIWVEQE